MAVPPARGILAQRRITNRQVARAIGRSETIVSRVLTGAERPDDGFVKALAEYTGIAPEVLFAADPVAKLLASRAVQGLPDRVEDASVLRRAAVLNDAAALMETAS